LLQQRNSEELFEFGDDDGFDVPTDAGEGADNMPSFGWSSISERYIAGKVKVHLHFRLREPEVADFCAVFKGTTEGDIDLSSDKAQVRDEGAMRPPLAPAVGKFVAGPAHEAQTLVPIYAGEFVEEHEFVAPSTVRLQLLDSCYCFRVHRPNFVHASSRVVPAGGVSVGLLEGLAAGTDGEADVPLVRLSGAQGGKSPGEVFEGASHVLESVSDDDAQIRWRLLEHLSVEDVLATVRIGFVDNSIRFSGGESGKFVAENFQVVVCPVELEASTCE
jgi:hypothetical protein